ncbi:MAG: hypothetical protein IPF92_15200 [Myxococcales bacterium]|nr:hypothetical protein [Myxococcales bacterium]MBL0195221.1 hypothetical protein [Myxococcales bacterium]HQY63340.1 hypothetical protein [Polyangiaceae bacterium]
MPASLTPPHSLLPVALLSAALVLGACSSEPIGGGPPSPTTTPGGAPTPGIAGPNVVGPAGIAEWDALGSKADVTTFRTLYLHQSVGQDLQGGAARVGFKFEYYGPNQADLKAGLNGGLFGDVGPVDNGKPMEKMAVVRRVLARHRASLRVLSFKFGYADVRSEDLEAVETEYVKLVAEVKAAGVRFVHVTPPLVFDVSENAPKMRMRSFMLERFKDDTIFDLQDLESLDRGVRCERGGVWHICQANRSTAACPSNDQGIDGDGQGHLCSTKATELAKAMLLALHRAGVQK